MKKSHLMSVSLLSFAVLTASECTISPQNFCLTPSDFDRAYGNPDTFDLFSGLYINDPEKRLEVMNTALALPGLNDEGRVFALTQKASALRALERGEEAEQASLERRAAQNHSKDLQRRIDAFDSDDKSRAQPVVRTPPTMPYGAESSGYCYVSFDVSPVGKVENLAVIYCTDYVFGNAALNSVERFKYAPKKVNDVPARDEDIIIKITFMLSDECGIIYPIFKR